MAQISKKKKIWEKIEKKVLFEIKKLMKGNRIEKTYNKIKFDN